MRSVRLQSLLRKRLASALMLGIAFLSAPVVSAQEVEPNSSCAASQDLRGSNLPVTLQGSLNSPPATPDVDFYRFRVEPYSLIVIDLDGAATGGGTLGDPYLGVFNESCGYIAYNDDYNSLSSHLEITAPASGEIVVGATSYGDWEFTGRGATSGSYRLSVRTQTLARAIGGRVVDSATGAPLPNKYVTLFLCAVEGYCSSYVGSAMTDSQGAFRFENGTYTMARPLVPGDYSIALGGNGYESVTAGPFTLAEGQDLSVGDLTMQRVPAIGSIQGRLVDEITGAPLSGTVAPMARVELLYCHTWGCSTQEYLTVAADGTFRFESTSDYLQLPPGTYQISASADQYQPTLSATFEVADLQQVNIGDVKVKSLPVRINLGSSCGSIPAEGGECRFSMRVTNGATTRLEGEAWAIVNGSWIGSIATHTSFELGNPRALSLAPGDSVTLPLSFQVPGTINNGATICVRGYAAQRPHEFNTLGTHDLFCFSKGYGGFNLVPENKKHDAVKKAEKP